MLPVTAGIEATRLQIVLYSLILVGVSFLPYAMGYAGLFYGLTALSLNALFLALAVWLLLANKEQLPNLHGVYLSIQSFIYFCFLPVCQQINF